MPKSQEHIKMVDALKRTVVTQLRELGFQGSFPHFRRLSDEQIDLLTFQFDPWGGGFVIEISKCPASGVTKPWGEHIPPSKVKAWDMHPSRRLRLQPSHSSSTSDWFRYDNASLNDEIYEKTAKDVLPFIKKAEIWWQEKTAL